MFKVPKSFYVFESTGRFIYEHTSIDLWCFKPVQILNQYSLMFVSRHIA